ncbi:C25 family cysteine peptidase [uncultured Desulfobacter sp.]|uniref:C25 family cysteine peptidase n=1 Tax=uncultured Desulfobacter sp. TaxID=240139 RepID=UPI0029F5BC45|nr:C25 family cysteine peptidase [uncultured Desulfobacter sp.]
MNRSKRIIQNQFYAFSLFAILFFGIIVTEAMGAEKLDYAFETPKIMESKTNMPSGTDLTKFSGLPFSSVIQRGTIPYAAKEGLPILPVKIAKILIPPGHRVSNISVSPGEKRQMEGNYNVEYMKRPQITTDKSSNTTPPDSEIYRSAKEFPGVLYKKVGIQHKQGATVLLINLFPVQYVPAKGILLYYENLNVSVETTMDKSENRSTENENQITDLASVINFVDNPQTIELYPDIQLNENGFYQIDQGFFLKRYPYIIITNKALSASFKPLISHKQNRGISAKIFFLSDIYSHYSGTRPDGGTDNQTKIRNFIRGARLLWGTRYVLLGGDDEIIPHRGAYGRVNTTNGVVSDTDIPTDLYYACLDGTWDNDADGIYGESNDGYGGGEIDLYSDVYVGRAPVNTEDEADNFVNKTIQFETSRFTEKALMTGTQLNEVTWGGDHKDLITPILPPTWTVDTLYDKEGTCNTGSVVNFLDSNEYIIMNSAGHGSNSNFSHIDRGDVDGLTNTVYPLIYTWACYTASFDNRRSYGSYETDDAVAEHFVKNPNGAFAFIGNSRYGWYSPGSTGGTSQQFDETFFDTLFNDNIINLGKTLADSKEDLIGSVGATGSYRWVYFCLNLLGDPETPFSTDPVCYPDLNAPKLSLKGTQTIPLHGNIYKFFKLNVTNWSSFPNDLFTPSPWLPPCGSNPNASRTWIKIYDQDDRQLYGFCAFNSNDDLTKIWFSVRNGNPTPKSVYVVLEDRECDIKYTSNKILIPRFIELPHDFEIQPKRELLKKEFTLSVK